jgi:hypothetical protein
LGSGMKRGVMISFYIVATVLTLAVLVTGP